MTALTKIAFYQHRRDEVPNQELARELAVAGDAQGIGEIAENLWNQEPNVRSDCLKVLYEIGYLRPELVADYAADFLKLLHSKNNRLVWGGMIALSTVAALRAEAIYPHVPEIKSVMERGSVITVDAGVRTLAAVAAGNEVYAETIFPYLLQHLETCRPKEVPQHSESTLAAVNTANKLEFVDVLTRRMVDMSSAQAARVRKVIRAAEKR